MRHTSEILKELGFNENAPDSTKRAFLKHLEQAARVEKSTGCSTIPPLPKTSASEQLSFDFSDFFERPVISPTQK